MLDVVKEFQEDIEDLIEAWREVMLMSKSPPLSEEEEKEFVDHYNEVCDL